MLRIKHTLVIGFIGALALGAPKAQAELEVSAGVAIHATADFYTPLSAAGVWVDIGGRGRCWHPAHISVDWRPYCVGHWVWTDCGWYWASDEPWAWACYHYGWWTLDPVYGWVWVPGVEWAPAWVYWRVGGGFIGWAPCPPHGVIVAPAAFVFVGERHFHDDFRPTTVIVNNTTIIQNTRQITEVKRETRTLQDGRRQTVVVNEGPGVAVVQQATGRKLSAVPITEAVRQTPAPPTLNARASHPPSGRVPGTQAEPAPRPAPQNEWQTPPKHGAREPVPPVAPHTSPPKPVEPVHPHEGRPPRQKEAMPAPALPRESHMPRPTSPQHGEKNGGRNEARRQEPGTSHPANGRNFQGRSA